MSYKLKWTSKYGTETIEENIPDKETATHLQKEYTIAYNEGTISVEREN